MGKNTTPAIVNTANDSDEWETINTGSLGEEWDFEADGPLVGNYLGTRTVETAKVESGYATAILFAPTDSPDDVVFIWQSADLSIFTRDDSIIREGDKVKVSFLGRRNFTGADGKPRQMKQYKVQLPKM